MSFESMSKEEVIKKYVREQFKEAIRNGDRTRSLKLDYFFVLFMRGTLTGYSLYHKLDLPAWVEGELLKITL